MDTAAGREERYLLVIGNAQGHQLKSFATEAEARAAFVAARLRSTPKAEWGELVSMDTGGHLSRLCWFGASAGAAPSFVLPASPARRRRRWLRSAS